MEALKEVKIPVKIMTVLNNNGGDKQRFFKLPDGMKVFGFDEIVEVEMNDAYAYCILSDKEDTKHITVDSLHYGEDFDSIIISTDSANSDRTNEITIDTKITKHLVGISEYNHNYYKLPDGMEICGCDVVLEIMEDDSDYCAFILGKSEEGAFDEDKDHTLIVSSYGSGYCYHDLIIELDKVI